MAAQPPLNCDPDSGYPMTEGPSILNSPNLDNLCTTDLYFNCGDYDGLGQAACEANEETIQAPTFGPCWSRNANSGCPLDDPSNASMGPIFGDDPATHDQEANGLGFGFVLGHNPAEGVGDGMHSFAMYVR
jgi:hypothetical protein